MKKVLALIVFTFTFLGVLASPTVNKDYSMYKTNILISPEKAAEIMAIEDDIVILDVRKKSAFEEGHIKGSYQIWRPDFSADEGEYEYGGMRANKEKMEQTLSSYGVTPNTHIILLSAKADYDAARLWWLLDYYGHTKVSMIDGGIDGWKSAGLETTIGEAKKPAISTKYVFSSQINQDKYASIEDVKAAIKDDNVYILDTRTDFEHDGLALYSGAFSKGRIPTTKYIPWDHMVNPDKTFKSSEEIRAILMEEGVDENSTIISYCQSGVRSAHMTFVLSELLGLENAKNYDGSWIEWSYNDTLGNVEVEKDNIFKIIFSYLTDREKLELVLEMLGVWGPLAYIILYALITITMITVLPITIAGGIIFGPIMGIIYTAIGAGLGLSLAFLIARYVARGAIEKKFGDSAAFKKIDSGVRKDGWFILATTRLLPIFPFGIQNYVYGLTSISFIQYAVLSVIFILPGTSVFVMLAGAFASGDKATVIKYSVMASLIFLGLMIVTKIVKKKSESSQG